MLYKRGKDVYYWKLAQITLEMSVWTIDLGCKVFFEKKEYFPLHFYYNLELFYWLYFKIQYDGVDILFIS